MNTWFRLDIQAMQDEKLIVLRKRCGFEGIGVYFMLAMECYKNGGALPAEKIPVLFEAYDIKNGEKILEAIVNVCLLKKKNDVYVSDRITKEIAIAKENAERRKNAGHAGGVASAKSRKKANREAIVKQPSTNVNDGQPHNSTLHNNTLPSLGKNFDEKPKRQEKPDSEVLKQFWDLAKNEEWTTQDYEDAKTKQFYELDKDGKEEILEKMQRAINCSFSKSESTRRLAKKIYHETVGLIQDRALDKSTIDGKTLAKRREFSGND